MVKSDQQRVEEQAAKAAELQRRLSRPPSLSRRMWAKYRKFQRQAMSGSDRLPKEDHWGKWRTAAGNLIFSHIFEAFMGIVILFNIFLIIIETDRRIHCVDRQSPECPANAPDIVLPDKVCLAIYIVELALRTYVYQRKFLLTPWNVFDACIVGLSILGEIFGSFFKDAVIIRVIRITRLVKMLRLLTSFQELYLIMAGMASTVRTIFWASFVLMAVLSVQALVAVELLRPVAKDLQQQGAFKDCPRCNRAFDSVVASMITFFQMLLMGDGVSELLVPLIEEANWVAGIFLVISTIFVYLGLSNLILSVIVEKAQEARDTDSYYTSLVHNKANGEAKKTLIDYWKTADLDLSDALSLEELRSTYNQEEFFRSYFVSQDMDLTFLEYAFKVGLKGREEDGEVNFGDLAEAVVKMKNTEVGPVMSLVKCQVATIIDEINTLQNQVLQLTGDLSDHMAITAREYNSGMNHQEPYMSQNGDQKGGLFGGTFLGVDWWSSISSNQPVTSKQAEAQHYSSAPTHDVHAIIDVDQLQHASEVQIQSEEDGSHQEADEWSDDPHSGPRPWELHGPHSSQSGRPDMAEMLKSAYCNALPLDLPNLDDVQRNFAKLCERVEAQLDRLDRHWIDDADQTRVQSKKEVYAAGARLLGRLGKSMTQMLNESGAAPPKQKLRRHQWDRNPYYGQAVANDIPPPPAICKPSDGVARSRTFASDDADTVMQTSSPRPAATKEVGHEGRKGRHLEQDERSEKRHLRSKTRKNQSFDSKKF